ncbi:MAG: pyk, Pyruvate kinase [Candidatus Saccharibacteria bacterium]|nr:pyk, Pyruvate kinase [Candidatus Saccharibacteria bacterium]
MQQTDSAPRVPLEQFKRTKIIATVGPATDSFEAIRQLIEEGTNGIRLNFSHGSHEERTIQIEWVRKASEELGKPVAIIQDLQGPKIRLGDFDGSIDVVTDQDLSFQYGITYAPGGPIPTQYDLATKVKVDERIYLFDGKVKTIVTDVRDGIVYARAQNNGTLLKRKGMNLPDTDFGGDIITDKDKADIEYGATQDIDYVALSFVQSATDIENLRTMLTELGSSAKVIAKIETKAAVDELDAIVQAADAVMIARGDLAVETPAESVPVVQRQIVGLGLRYAKPTIVATQMLMSMTENPEPSRAEVSDVATAVFIGADCVMLSDETANGKYPHEAVATMKRIVLYAENNTPLKVKYESHENHSRQASISRAVVRLAENIASKAIVAETRSGATALDIAALRTNMPIIAVTSEARTAQQLAICYSVKSYVRPIDAAAASKLTDWLRQENVLHAGDVVVSASGRYPGVVGTTDTIKVRVLE